MQWPAWRLWCERRISLTELDRMTIDEVQDANTVLDEWQAAERRASKRKS